MVTKRTSSPHILHGDLCHEIIILDLLSPLGLNEPLHHLRGPSTLDKEVIRGDDALLSLGLLRLLLAEVQTTLVRLWEHATLVRGGELLLILRPLI
jgi:hypothetical protein